MQPNLIQYLGDHGLSGERVGNKILTLNIYVDRDGITHREPILISATWSAVREFLGY